MFHLVILRICLDQETSGNTQKGCKGTRFLVNGALTFFDCMKGFFPVSHFSNHPKLQKKNTPVSQPSTNTNQSFQKPLTELVFVSKNYVHVTTYLKGNFPLPESLFSGKQGPGRRVESPKWSFSIQATLNSNICQSSQANLEKSGSPVPRHLKKIGEFGGWQHGVEAHQSGLTWFNLKLVVSGRI